MPMTHRTLIVARMNSTDASAVASAFRESDAGDLPRLVGVTQRDLFHFHGLYFHLVEAPEPVERTLPAVREHPLFVNLNSRLEKYVTAYDPETWRGPRDAMADHFYSWKAG
jgi:cyclase